MVPVDLAEITAGIVSEGVGHPPNLERPDDVNEHLLRLLSRALP
jgi:hypothetical protein